jgi:S-adenosylmethionine:tRNA ribosyltransferase-isomerase
LKTSDFSFELPDELIAQVPAPERGDSRMMLLERETESIGHWHSSDFPDLLEQNSLLVINDARVRRARLYGTSDSGGTVEFLLLKPEDPERLLWLAMVTKAKRQRPGKKLLFPDKLTGIIEATEARESGPFRLIRFDRPVEESYLDKNGHMPLPPYIRREDGKLDETRYQTVYARTTGSVAAPTAGLHFTEEAFRCLAERSIPVVRLTLHVGLGTFLPVRSEELSGHEMHREEYEISEEAARDINDARRVGRKIVAVGTTSVRTLESAWDEKRGELVPGRGETALFIYPGYRFKAVDQLFTNFHTPKSTLLMLVSAFAGKDFIDRAYREAVKRRYRFFSYGDSMFIR